MSNNQSLFGYHEILPAQVPNNHLIDLNPAAHIVVGTHDRADQAIARAQEVKYLLPECTVILRMWPDDQQSSTMTPQQLIDHIAPYIRPGIIMSVDNEPAVEDIRKLGQWYADVLNLAGRRKWGLAVGAFATGNPHQDRYIDLAPMFKELERTTGYGSVWTPHAYYDPDDKGHLPWHIHRHQAFGWQVCDSLGIKRPTTIIGEVGLSKGYNPLHGWLATRLSGEDYARQLIGLNLNIPACIFAWGEWHSFGVNNSPGFMKTLVAESKRRAIVSAQPTPIPTGAALGKSEFRKLSGEANLRDGTNRANALLQVVPNDSIVSFYPATLTSVVNGYRWAVCSYNGKVGWMALTGSRLPEQQWQKVDPAPPSEPVKVPVQLPEVMLDDFQRDYVAQVFENIATAIRGGKR